MTKKALLLTPGPNRDQPAIAITSQLGASGDATHTIYNQPWIRVVMGGGRFVGDTMHLVIDGSNNASAVLSATDITRGYIDLHLTAPLSSGMHSLQSFVTRSGGGSSLKTSLTTLTIFPFPFDGMPGLYAAHGLQRLLTSYVGPLAQAIRISDSTTVDLFAGIDGYINMGQGLSYVAPQIGEGDGDGAAVHITKLYDQTGNGRHATPTSSNTRPTIFSSATTAFGSQPQWGTRSQLYFSETQSPSPQQLTVGGMGAFDQNQTGITLVACVGWVFLANNGGFNNRSLISISVNGGTGRRAALFSDNTGAFATKMGGRRLDADTEADAPGINDAGLSLPTILNPWTVVIARFDYANAMLFYNAFGTSTLLASFQTPGNSANSTSDHIIIGGNAAGESTEGAIMGMGWFQGKLSDANVAALAGSGNFNYTNIPRMPLYRPGVVEIETFRSAIRTKLYLGTSGFPAGGFDTTSTGIGDPLAGSVGSPSNLLRVDSHTVLVKNDVGTTIRTDTIYVWFPTVVTSNGKLVVYQAGNEGVPPDDTFKDATLIKTLVQAGYTVADMDGPYPPGNTGGSLPDPTGTLTPMRYFIEGPIRTINALGGGFSHTMALGFSSGASVVCLLAAADPRIVCTISHDYNIPIFAEPESRYERMMPGLVDLATTGGCDFPDLWLCGTTGGSVGQRQLCLSYCGTLASNLFGNADFITPSISICAAYGGVLSTNFDPDTAHHWGTSAIANVIALFGQY